MRKTKKRRRRPLTVIAPVINERLINIDNQLARLGDNVGHLAYTVSRLVEGIERLRQEPKQ